MPPSPHRRIGDRLLTIMRGRADELAPGVDHKLWRSNENFFRSGTSGQWRDLLGSAALDRYRSRVAELAPPELAEWLHRP